MGDLVGKMAGKAKEAAGSLVGNGDLSREGRLQQAQTDARSHALREKEAALAASDEASRLREAASRAKTARRAQ